MGADLELTDYERDACATAGVMLQKVLGDCANYNTVITRNLVYLSRT